MNAPQTNDIIPVDDLNDFVQMLSTWHATQCQIVQHLLLVPEGSSFEIDGKELVMSGETLEGFKLGVEMVMMQFGTLPFVAEVEEDAAPSQTPQPAEA